MTNDFLTTRVILEEATLYYATKSGIPRSLLIPTGTPLTIPPHTQESIEALNIFPDNDFVAETISLKPDTDAHRIYGESNRRRSIESLCRTLSAIVAGIAHDDLENHNTHAIAIRNGDDNVALDIGIHERGYEVVDNPDPNMPNQKTKSEAIEGGKQVITDRCNTLGEAFHILHGRIRQGARRITEATTLSRASILSNLNATLIRNYYTGKNHADIYSVVVTWASTIDWIESVITPVIIDDAIINGVYNKYLARKETTTEPMGEAQELEYSVLGDIPVEEVETPTDES